MADLTQEVSKMYGAFVDAVNRQDLDLVADTYATNCAVMGPGVPTQHGREAGRKLFAAFADSGFHAFKVDNDEIVTFSPDNAALRGKYFFYKKDGTVGEKGKQLLIFMREDGKLKIKMDFWNLD